MRILLGHTFPVRPNFGSTWIEGWLERLRYAGIEVYPFSLVFNEKSPIVYFGELDVLWRYGNHKLLTMYQKLADSLLNFDAFICFNGANVHPEFVRQLKCFTVYGCFDDPEASEKLSKPVAGAFDMAMVGNIAEIDTYKSWGVQHVRWWPLGFRHDDYNPSLTEQEIYNGHRDIEVALLCERLTRWRRKRLDKFAASFPNGIYHGPGWPNGFLPESKRVPILQSTRIGINIHNSTGPINFRTFYLPANGVMQICDNKLNLGKIYELGSEVVGFDSIEDAIELTHYYIEHDDERRSIAAAGWKRSTRDYNEIVCFKRVVDAIAEMKFENKNKTMEFKPLIVIPRYVGKRNYLIDRLVLTTWIVMNTLRRFIRGVGRNALDLITNLSHRLYILKQGKKCQEGHLTK